MEHKADFWRGIYSADGLRFTYNGTIEKAIDHIKQCYMPGINTVTKYSNNQVIYKKTATDKAYPRWEQSYIYGIKQEGTTFTINAQTMDHTYTYFVGSKYGYGLVAPDKDDYLMNVYGPTTSMYQANQDKFNELFNKSRIPDAVAVSPSNYDECLQMITANQAIEGPPQANIWPVAKTIGDISVSQGYIDYCTMMAAWFESKLGTD
jgi:hypothetical protein